MTEGENALVLYVVPGCPLCADARDILNAAKKSFVERDVANDFSALRRMYKNTKQSLVPVVERSGKFIVRPDRDQLREI